MLCVQLCRIEFQGSLYRWITFRLQAEPGGTPYLRDAWADFRFRPWLRLRAGQTKPPFSTAWLTGGNNVHSLERGANTPIHTFFDRGFWLRGEILDKAVTYRKGYPGLRAFCWSPPACLSFSVP